VIPYVALSLITGLGGLSIAEVKGLALKGGGALLTVWAVTLVIVVLIPLAFPIWPSGSFFSTSLVEETKAPDFLRLFIPSNPFHSFANAIVPAVVVFCILIGVALIGLANKAVVLEPLSVLRDGLMRVAGMVAKLAPIGVFALMANSVGTIDVDDLARLQVFVVLQALFALVLGLWVVPALVAAVTPYNYRDIMRALRTPLITAFATGSSLVVLPMLIERCERLIAEAGTLTPDAEHDADSSVEVLIPTIFTFPSPGALLALSFILFGGWYIGSSVPLASYPILIAAGVPSLFGGTVLAVPFLLDLFRLPNDLFQVFLSVDVIGSRFGTLFSAMHYAAVGLIGATAMVGGLRLQWMPLARFALVSVVLIAAVLIGVRAFYTHVVVAPYTKDNALKGLTLLVDPQPATVYTEVPPELPRTNAGPTSLAEIMDRGSLRACYLPNAYPSAFYNTEDPPALVGFDIEMAHRFAARLGLPIEFIPADGGTDAAGLLNTGVCDVYMRTLPVSAARTQIFGLSSSVYRSAFGLIVKDHRRAEFDSWEKVRARGVSFRVAIDGSPNSLVRLRALLPKAELVPLYDMAEQAGLLESGGEEVDAIADLPKKVRPGPCSIPRTALLSRSRPYSSPSPTPSPAATMHCWRPSTPG